jgi:hypothetical protein
MQHDQQANAKRNTTVTVQIEKVTAFVTRSVNGRTELLLFELNFPPGRVRRRRRQSCATLPLTSTSACPR